MNELHYAGLVEIGRLIQSRKITSVEVTKKILQRIDEFDPYLHSYFYVMRESALQQAANADAQIAQGNIIGPLQGVPLALKDLIWTSNAPTTNGMAENKGLYPPEDSTLVTRFKEAGAVILGKLSQTEGAFLEFHPDFPLPRNPWNEALWTGVSSSGSAVATAAGLCFGAIGSDTGGSIRFPCNANGLTGIKPTWGRVTRHGAFELAASLDHIGTMARSIEDAAAMLQAIAGRDDKDPSSSTVPVPDYLALMTQGVNTLRIGLDKKWALDKADKETVVALLNVIKILSSQGAEIVDIHMPDTDQAAHDWSPLCGVEAARVYEESYPSNKEKFGPALAGLLELGHTLQALEYQRLLDRRADLRNQISALFNKVDLILSPAVSFAGLTCENMSRLGSDKAFFSGVVRYTSVFDLTGHPTITLPCGFTPIGAPIGFQIIAAHFDETRAIQAAWSWQQNSQWHKRHPRIPT